MFTYRFDTNTKFLPTNIILEKIFFINPHRLFLWFPSNSRQLCVRGEYILLLYQSLYPSTILVEQHFMLQYNWTYMFCTICKFSLENWWGIYRSLVVIKWYLFSYRKMWIQNQSKQFLFNILSYKIRL